MKKLYSLVIALFLFSHSYAYTIGPITGDSSICIGSATTLSDTSGGGVWSSTDASVATIGVTSGTVVGLLAGTTLISYTISGSLYATFVLTVNVAPAAITGPAMVYTGDSITLSDLIAGGVWSGSNTIVAMADSATGVVRGLPSGTVHITYTLGNGCYTFDSVRVYDLATSLSGAGKVCTGDSITLTDSIPGGTWTSSDTTIAKVDSGIVTGIAAGTATITYTVDTNHVTQVVTVNASPGAIMGESWVSNPPCPATTLTDTSAGGVWVSSDTSFAFIDSSGLLTLNPRFMMLTVNVDTITYTLPSGCSVMKLMNFIGCEGVPTIPNTNEVSIFPNPAHDELTIQSSHDAINQILITNLLGQTVSLQTAPAACQLLQVDVPGLPSGVYFVKVNGVEVRKFVKE